MKRTSIFLVLLCSALRLFSAEEMLRTNANFNVRVWETGLDALPQSSVPALAQTPDGYLWLGTLNGLVRFDGMRFVVFDAGNTPALEDSRVVKLAVGSDNTLWIGTETKVVQLKNGKFFPQTRVPPELQASRTPRVLVDSFWRSNNFSQIHEEFPWGARRINAVCDDRQGNLIVGTDGAGVFWLFHDGTIIALNPDNGLSHSVILSLLVDREGTLWVGTDTGGLNRVTPNSFKSIPETRGWTITSIAGDKHGTVWMGTGANGLASWREGKLVIHGPVFAGGTGWKVVFASGELVWLGAASGTWKLDQEIVKPVFELRQEPRAIFKDQEGRMWFGTDGGAARFDGTNWTFFTMTNGLSSDAVTSFAQDRQGALWIGTRRGGINRIMDGKFASFRKRDGAPSDDIAALLIDSQGVLWITTQANGLGRFQNGQWTHYTTRDGLVSNGLGYLLDDDQGSLWIGSTIGLLRVSKRALNAYAEGQSSVVSCSVYGKGDGLPTSECSSPVQPGALRDGKGTLWFPTVKGLAVVDPAQLNRNTNPPLIVIESVRLDSKPRLLRGDLSDPVILGPQDSRIEIDYAALNLAAPERALCRYRLEGFESGWVEAGNGRTASYSRLPAGEYMFHVIAANEDGIWNETGRSLAIIVQPPFWRTWWFIALVTVATISAIAGSVHYFSTQRLQRELAVLRQQEALEKERARIARDIHDQVGASLTQVALLGELVESDKDSPADVEDHAKQISQTARETTRALDEIVWTVNPQNDTLEGLVNYICKYAQDYLGVAGVKYRLDVPTDVPAMSIAPDVRHNVFLAAKEAVTNIVRHAKATAAVLRMQWAHSSFVIEIEDNGLGLGGMDRERAKTRHGLSNMRKRMEEIGGQFVLEPAGDVGARVRLSFPLKNTAANM